MFQDEADTLHKRTMDQRKKKADIKTDTFLDVFNHRFVGRKGQPANIQQQIR